jgi:hypothetical protein
MRVDLTHDVLTHEPMRTDLSAPSVYFWTLEVAHVYRAAEGGNS